MKVWLVPTVVVAATLGLGTTACAVQQGYRPSIAWTVTSRSASEAELEAILRKAATELGLRPGFRYQRRNERRGLTANLQGDGYFVTVTNPGFGAQHSIGFYRMSSSAEERMTRAVERLRSDLVAGGFVVVVVPISEL